MGDGLPYRHEKVLPGRFALLFVTGFLLDREEDQFSGTYVFGHGIFFLQYSSRYEME